MYFAMVEATVMLATVGLAVALAATPPPEVNSGPYAEPGGDRARLSASRCPECHRACWPAGAWTS